MNKMARLDYYNTYPNIENGNLAVDQTSFKQMIIDFNNAMLQAGLVRSPDTGQLDATNTTTIPNLVLTQNTTSVAIGYGNGQNEGVATRYLAPLIYCFTDSFQTTNPIYIKIQFGIGQMCAYNASYNQLYGFITKVSIGTKTNGAGTVSNGAIDWCMYYGYHLINYSVTNSYNFVETLNTSNKNSYINYNSSKGLLHVELLPRIFQGITAGPASEGAKGFCLKFVISRNQDGSAILLWGGWAPWPYSSTAPGVNQVVPYILYPATIYSDNSFYSYSAFNRYKSLYKNGMIYTAPFLSLLSDQVTITQNKNLLVGGTNMLGNISGMRYKVQISDTESYWYRTWSTGDNYVNFNNDASTCLLILDE
jgi:hypothetical protein